MRGRPKHDQRAFTLVEAAVVVVIVGVLAAISTVWYVRHRRAARMNEATQLVTSIRAEQEAYKQERGTYASISNSVDSFYPAANPGKFATAWGGPCANCVNAQAWNTLGVKPAYPVVYGYSTIAGVGAEMVVPPTAGTSSGTSGETSMTSSGGPDDDDATPPSGPTCASIAPTQPYFLIKAKGDTDGDGIPSTVLALSCTNQLILTNEGE